MELYNKEFVYFDWDDKLKGKKGFFADNIEDLKRDVKDNNTQWYGEIFKNSRSDDEDVEYPFETIDNSGWHRNFRFAYYDPYYEFRKAYIEGKQLQFKNHEGDWENILGAPLFTDDEYRVKPEYRIKPEWYLVLDDYGLSHTNEPNEDETVLSKGTEEECIQYMEKYKPFKKILLAWRQGRTIQYKENDEWVDWAININPNTNAFDTWKEWRIKDECEGCMKYNYCTNKKGVRCRNYCTEVEHVPFDTLDELIHKWEGMNPGCTNRPACAMPMMWVKRKRDNTIHLIANYYPDGIGPRHSDVGTDDEHLTFKELFEDYTFINDSIIGKRADKE